MPANNEIAFISLFVSIVAIIIAIWVRVDQKKHGETELRRDVLRRIMGYAYRLTEGAQQLDGEPFTALNEALVVFNNYPKVKELLRKFHQELGAPGRFAPNYLGLIKEMAEASGISIEFGDSSILERPFGPKKPPDFSGTGSEDQTTHETTS